MDEAKNIDKPNEPYALKDLTPEEHPELFGHVGVKSTQIDVSWVEKISFWSIVWAQFRKNKIAMFGLYCIFLFVVIAVFAPVCSLDKAFFCYISGEGIYLPWFKSLFDRNFFQNGVDIFFNLMMVLSPVYLFALWFIRRKMGKNFSLHFTAISLSFVAVHMILYAIVSFFGEYGVSASYYDMVEKQISGSIDQTKKIEGKSDAKSVYYLYPPRRFSFRQTDITEINPRPPSSKFWLGTDKEGRDIFAIMLYGTRISLTIGMVAVIIYTFIGVVLGAMAGYFGGKVDLWISRFIEIMICFPTFFLILTLAAFVEKPSIFYIMVIIGVTRWTTVARLIRAEFLRLRNIDYVQAAIALGFDKSRIMFGHMLPNALGPVLVSATFGVAASILIESSLSFLGLGDPTAPSWGVVLSDGRLCGKLWLILTPGLAIFFVVSIFNLVGEGLRDALDPKLRQ